MKLLKLVLAVLLIPGIVFAETKAQIKSDLVGLGMPSELSRYFADLHADGNVIVDNADFLKWRNAANSANINGIGVNASDDLEIRSDSGDTVVVKIDEDANRLTTFDASSDTALSLLLGDGGTTAAQVYSILCANADADDDCTLVLGHSGPTRGAGISLYGNETASNGAMALTGGDEATSNINVDLGHASAAFQVRNTSGTAVASFGNSGNLVFPTTGSTIAVDSGTAASACKGTGTFNGTTAVTVSTTCASTSAFVALTPTSTSGGTASHCWFTNIVNGTSFDVDCDAANTGTFAWVIVKEG